MVLMAMDRISPRSAFIRARKAEELYIRQLRNIAKAVGDLIRGMWHPDEPAANDAISAVLNRYAKTLEPWAEAVGRRMITEVSARNYQAWMMTARRMGRDIEQEIMYTPLGGLYRQRLNDQVDLITSLPREAAERVHRLSREAMVDSRRASEVATEIMRSGEVTRRRATLIARTEVGRTSTEFTRARAESIGSSAYKWRTAEDSDVRESHRGMAGKTVLWSDPPVLDGLRGHAGALPNCRCYAEPIVPEL